MIDLKIFAICLILVPVSKSVYVINIKEWDLEYNNNEFEKFRVPTISGIFTAASSKGIIPKNLFYKYNTKYSRGIANHTWQYSTEISGEDFRFYDNVNLVIEGVDTFAKIIFNDKELLTTNNMFVKYIIKIPKEIQRKNNKIKLIFTSPLKKAEQLYLAQNKMHIIPPGCPPVEFDGDCYVNLIRKMQASFSWDWGPSVPSIGIWKPIYIEAYNQSLIRDVITHIDECDSTHWELLIDVQFADNKRSIISGQITVSILDIVNSSHVSIHSNEYSEFTFSTRLVIKKSLVDTWWPNGYGRQPLYDLNISFASKNEIFTKVVRVGFRKIELVQDKIKGGLTFYFKVNNIPIFAKGTNLVPVDIRPEVGEDISKIHKLLSVARDQHMNMIRIWGGGVYGSDYFYDLADEYGILIWQDFMFACALYPATKTFLSNVLDEVRTQVKRIYHHPSLALFAGNNENEGAIAHGWFGVFSDSYKKDYKKLYIDTIEKEYLRLTHNKGIFLTSSPTNGRVSDESQYGLSSQPGSHYSGDVHAYNYHDDTLDPSTFPIARFISEYGYQSLPCSESFLKDTNDKEDLGLHSEFMNFRQHHPGGNRELQHMIEKNLELPEKNNKNYDNVVIYYSQIIQALSMKVETERYRNYRGILLKDGRGNTMGALYWQFNDVWTAPSWSGIDFYGRWKMLQYFIHDVFCPIIITGELSAVSNKLKIFVITDVHAIENANALIQLYRYSSLESIYEEKIPVSLARGTSAIVHTITDIDKYIEKHECSRSNCFISLKLSKNGQQLAPDNYILLDKPKKLVLPQAHVQITSIKKGPSKSSFLIDISTNVIALFVWLDAHEIDGRFSENGFLLAQTHKQVIFYCEGEVSYDEMEGNLTVTHLRDKKYFPN